MRTEKEIKEAVKNYNDLDKRNALTDIGKRVRDILEWVLGKNFPNLNSKKKK